MQALKHTKTAFPIHFLDPNAIVFQSEAPICPCGVRRGTEVERGWLVTTKLQGVADQLGKDAGEHVEVAPDGG